MNSTMRSISIFTLITMISIPFCYGATCRDVEGSPRFTEIVRMPMAEFNKVELFPHYVIFYDYDVNQVRRWAAFAEEGMRFSLPDSLDIQHIENEIYAINKAKKVLNSDLTARTYSPSDIANAHDILNQNKKLLIKALHRREKIELLNALAAIRA